MKQRVEYIDLAKGICILLIALTHTFGDSGGQIMEVLSIFKIPIFFILSGFFFKRYDSFFTFVRKKVNQLLVPAIIAFLFFSLFMSILLSMKSGIGISFRDLFFLSNTWKINFGQSPSTWFLICLFEIDFISYVLYRLCNDRYLFIVLFAFLFGGFGFYINLKDISLPVWIDTAFTTLPYFVIGNLLWNKTDFMIVKTSMKHCVLFSVSLLILCYMVYSMDVEDNIFYAVNRYTDVTFVRLFVGGFMGSVFIVLLSKFVNKIPIISYIGRYSIVILITHQFYLFLFRNLLYQLGIPQDSAWTSLFVFILLVSISLPTIKYGIRYLPYFFAQKELLK